MALRIATIKMYIHLKSCDMEGPVGFTVKESNLLVMQLFFTNLYCNQLDSIFLIKKLSSKFTKLC